MARPLYSTPNGILAAAEECGIARAAFRQLPGASALTVLDSVLESFTNGGLTNRAAHRLWDDLREPTFSLRRRADAATMLALGDPATRVWLLVEDWERKKTGPGFWVFEATLDAAARTLDNHHLVEFYIVSRGLDWLVAENHHDMLVAAGEHAVEALQRLAR